MNTITDGTTTVEPLTIDGWDQSRASRNLAHPYIDGGQDYTIVTPSDRRGTLTLVFTAEEDALTCEAMHIAAPFLDLASDERTIANMRYVLSDGGQLGVQLDPETRDVWLVTVDFSEVTS